jgi:hypothetical protein
MDIAGGHVMMLFFVSGHHLSGTILDRSGTDVSSDGIRSIENKNKILPRERNPSQDAI